MRTICYDPASCKADSLSAVLGAYFLGERLGTLGKLGCATCLIGSVIIVLHAPPDKDVQTIDEILHYAIQPGTSRSSFASLTLIMTRLSLLRSFRCRIRSHDDLLDRSTLWQEESSRLPQHLQHYWQYLDLRRQGTGYCTKAYIRRQQSAYASFNIRIPHRDRRGNHDTDELFQQGAQPIQHQHVGQPIIPL